MITQQQKQQCQERAAAMLAAQNIVLTAEEREQIEVADFGLDEVERTGLELVVYVNTDRYCAKELVIFPRQSCPEHKHPTIGAERGKMETFRCRWGTVWLYVEGERSVPIQAHVPEGSEAYYTVFHEIELHAGEQYTIAPDTLHWFQGGEQGAIVSEFSSTSHDETDIFSNPRIRRLPV